jgi:DNA-binding MarR family transcriptional regulator
MDMTREEIFYEMIETIYEMSRKLSVYESVPRKYGTEDELYVVEAHTIDLIGTHTITTISELSKLTKKTKGAISQMVDKLIKKDLVIKYKNPNDNRQVMIELTDKGKKIYEFHRKLDKQTYSQYLERLTQYSTEDFLNYIKISNYLIKELDHLIDK